MAGPECAQVKWESTLGGGGGQPGTWGVVSMEGPAHDLGAQAALAAQRAGWCPPADGLDWPWRAESRAGSWGRVDTGRHREWLGGGRREGLGFVQGDPSMLARA